MPLQILMEEELEREAGLKREEISAPIEEEKDSALLDGDRWKTVSISAMAGLAFFGWLWMSVLEPRLNWFGARGPGPSSADRGSVEEARGDQSSYLHADTNLVKFVQSRLNQLGFRAGSVDGVVGPRTMEALERFQMSQGLLVTGVIDRKTKGALDKLDLPKGKSEPYRVARARREKFRSGPRFIVDLSMDPALSRKGVEKHVRRVTVRYAKANPDVKRFHVRGYLGIASLSAGAYAIADWNRKGKDVSALQGFNIRFQEWVRKDIVGTLPPPSPSPTRKPAAGN